MSSKEQKMASESVPDSIESTPEQQQVEAPEIQEEVNPLQQHIAELEAQLAEAQQREREALLRAKAEVENIRRRTEMDIEKAHKFALERFSSALLPVIDNLERALDVADKSNGELTSLIEGVELTLKSFVDAVGKFGIEVVNETNIPFNPEVHQAMTMLDSAEHQPNHVMMVLQKGYLLNGRLLRPAMVAVSKS